MAMARTGFPVNVVMPGSYTAPDGASGTQRPDLVPGVSLTPAGGKTVAKWINPAAFKAPVGEFGTAPRNLLRGPGTWQVDLGAAKTFSLWERATLQFRSEFYNIFNRPALTPPVTDVTNAQFGQIISSIGGSERNIQFGLRFLF